MDRKKITIGISALALLGFILVAAASFDSDTVDPANTSYPAEETASPADGSSKPDSEAADAGPYAQYAPHIIESATKQQDLVLFFHADWCPTCRALDEDIEANKESIPPDVTIAKVDFDSETALRQKYEVRLQHTLVQVDENGQQITKWHQSPTLEAVLKRIEG